MERRLETALDAREIEQIADDPPEAGRLGTHDPGDPHHLVRSLRPRRENLAESQERRERRPELVRRDGDEGGLRPVQFLEVACGPGDAALELLGEPPLARREARVFQRHRDVRTQRLERHALVAAELADPLDGEHADMLTGHEERRGDDAARAAAAPSVGDEHRRPGGEHARGQRALGHAVSTRDHQALTVTHDQPNVGDPQTLDERGAEASERGVERSRAGQRPLDRQERLVPRPLPARTRGEHAHEGADARDDGERHEPLARLRREPSALDLGEHDRRVEDERGPGAEGTARPAERERQRDDRDQIGVAKRRRGITTRERDQRRDPGKRQHRCGGEPACHGPVPSSRYPVKKMRAPTRPGTRLPDHQKSQQFPAPRSVR